jgi:hypothetical protein
VRVERLLPTQATTQHPLQKGQLLYLTVRLPLLLMAAGLETVLILRFRQTVVAVLVAVLAAAVQQQILARLHLVKVTMVVKPVALTLVVVAVGLAALVVTLLVEARQLGVPVARGLQTQLLGPLDCLQFLLLAVVVEVITHQAEPGVHQELEETAAALAQMQHQVW